MPQQPIDSQASQTNPDQAADAVAAYQEHLAAAAQDHTRDGGPGGQQDCPPERHAGSITARKRATATDSGRP